VDDTQHIDDLLSEIEAAEVEYEGEPVTMMVEVGLVFLFLFLGIALGATLVGLLIWAIGGM
jgi:hypothetical protein